MSPIIDRFNRGSGIGGSQPDKEKATGTVLGSSTDSDESLLIAIGISQDNRAFNQLFQRYASKIFALGLKLTRNEQLSNDLVQEAMLTIWQKAPLYDLDRGSAQSWIFTLSRNRCFDMLRKQKRQPSGVSADDIWPQKYLIEAVATNKDEGALRVEVAQVKRYYSELPAPQRAVIEQIFVFDRTHEETAMTLGIPLGTVKSRLRLGMAKLKQVIGVGQ